MSSNINKNIPPLKNLVFSGGGMKCMAYIGVIKYLEENNLLSQLNRVLGVSGGSIFALLLAIGMKSSQMHSLAIQLSKTDLVEFDYDGIRIENIIDFFKNLSVDNGTKLHNFFRSCLKVKLGNPDATFRDLYEYNPQIEIIILCSDINSGTRSYFSYLETPDFPVALAVKISCSIPLYMKPYIWQGRILVDGGLSSNYPIDYFEDDIDRTIGFSFKIQNSEQKVYDELPDFISYIQLLMSTSLSSQEMHLCQKYSDYTCYIISQRSDIVAFDMSSATKEEYIQIGYNAIADSIKKRNMRYNTEDDDSPIAENKRIVVSDITSTDEEQRETDEIKFEMNSMKNSSS